MKIHGIITLLTILLIENGSQADDCKVTNDLLIVVDSSSNFGPENFQKALEFAQKRTSDYLSQNINDTTTSIRVGFAVYSDTIQEVFGLNNTLTESEIDEKILAAPYLGSGSTPHLALEWASSHLSEHNNANDIVPLVKNVIVITNGHGVGLEAKAASERLRKAGARIFAISAGCNFDRVSLEMISGGPSLLFSLDDETHWYYRTALQAFSLLNCDGLKEQPDEPESLYFASARSGTTSIAWEQCIGVLGPRGSLISIETMEESAHVDRLVTAVNDAGRYAMSVYWTAVRYSDELKAFVWPGNVPVNPSLWGENQPAHNSTDARAINVLESFRHFRLWSYLDDDRYPYVCEYKRGV